MFAIYGRCDDDDVLLAVRKNVVIFTFIFSAYFRFELFNSRAVLCNHNVQRFLPRDRNIFCI